MARRSLIAIIGLACLAFAAPQASARPDRGRLTEKEIYSILAGLPYDFRFKDVRFSGNGAVVAGRAKEADTVTYFRIVSGNPKYHGKLLPKGTTAPVETVGPKNDLEIRISDNRRSDIDVFIAIEGALCDFRIQGHCGV